MSFKKTIEKTPFIKGAWGLTSVNDLESLVFQVFRIDPIDVDVGFPFAQGDFHLVVVVALLAAC